MKSITARSVILFLSVLSVVLAGLLVNSTFQEEEVPEALLELQKKQTEQALELEAYEALLQTDQALLFESDWEELRVQLEAQMNQAPEGIRSSIERRLSYINEALSEQRSEDAQLSRKDQLIRNQRSNLERLEFELDSLYKAKSNGSDSLNVLIVELKNELKAKANELMKQEKVKVISFAGVKGSTIHYMGEVENGKANGGGIGIWTTGSVYRGEWKDNLRHGKGAFEWADGERYEGDYIEGRREGDGVYYWPSGERYEGQWKNDRRTGSGILYDLDGNIRYDGMWKDDKPLSK